VGIVIRQLCEGQCREGDVSNGCARGRGRGQRGGTRLHTLAGRRGCHELADWVWAARVWGDGGEQVKKNGFHSEHWLPAKKEYGIQSRCRGGGHS